MTAKNQEYADLWDRLMDNQQRRKAAAAPDRAMEIIQAQRERDFVEYITDPDALLRMYGDRDTRICPSPAVKLYDANNPKLPEPKTFEELEQHPAFGAGVLVGMFLTGLVALMALAVGCLLV